MVSEVVSDVNALILAVTGLLGAIGSIVVAVATKFHLNSKIVQVGQSLEETDKWVLENQGKLQTILEVGYNLSPAEAKTALGKYQELIKKYNGDLQAATAELRKLYGPLSIPGVTQNGDSAKSDAI